MKNLKIYSEYLNKLNACVGYTISDVLSFVHTPNGLGEPNVIMKNQNTGKEVSLFIESGEVYIVDDESNNDCEYLCTISYFEDVCEEFEKINQCQQCDGVGYVEVGPSCSRPASECCGGCYHNAHCECDDYKLFS